MIGGGRINDESNKTSPAPAEHLCLSTYTWMSWDWRRSGGSRGGDSKRLYQSLGYRTPEQAETEYYANQAAQAALL